MGITVATTRVAVPTSTGTQDITTTDLAGLTPKAAMILLSYASSDGTAANNAGLSVGFTDGAKSYCLFINSEHGVTTTDTHSGVENVPVLLTTPGSASVDAKASFSAWLTNGIRLNWTTAPSTAYLMHVTFFAGSDLSADVDTAAMAGQDVEVDVTAPAFEPDLVLALTSLSIAGDSGSGSHTRYSFGAAHWDGVSVVTQRSFSQNSRNGLTTSEVSGAMSETYMLRPIGVGGSFAHAVDITSFDANGFSLYARNSSGSGDDVYFLALSFGGFADVKVGTHTTPTSTGESSETGIGFVPQAVIIGTTLLESADSVDAAGLGGQVGIAVIDEDEQYALAFNDEDAQTTTDTQSLSDDVCAVQPLHTGAAGIVATTPAADKFVANGWTFDYTTVTGTAKKWFYVAIEGKQLIQLSAAIAWQTATPSATLNVAFQFSATIAGQAATPDTAIAAVQRPLATVSGWSVATPSATAAIQRQLSAASAWATATPDAVTAVIRRLIIATSAWSTSTPDTIIAAVQRQLTITNAWTTTTPAGALAVQRQLSVTSVWTTTTPDNATLVKILTFTATLAWSAATPDIIVSAIQRSMAAVSAWAVTTPDTAKLVFLNKLSATLMWGSATPAATVGVQRQMVAATTWQGITPAAVTSILRPLVVTASWQTITPNTVTIPVLRPMATTALWQSATPAAVIGIARQIAGAAAWATTTPDTVTAVILRQLVSTETWTGTTPDVVVVAIQRQLAAVGAWATATPDTATAAIARPLAAIATWISATPDTVTAIIQRPLSVTVDWQSVTAAGVLGVQRQIAAVTDWQTATPSAVASIQRQMAATMTWVISTPDVVTIVVLRPLASVSAWATSTPGAVVGVQRQMSAASDWQSVTPAAVVGIQIQLAGAGAWQTATPGAVTAVIRRPLPATIAGQVVTNDDGILAVARLLTVIMAWQIATPAIRLNVIFVGKAILAYSSRNPAVTFTGRAGTSKEA